LGVQITKARARLDKITTSDEFLEAGSRLCMTIGADGLRGELTILRTARALAALSGAGAVTLRHLREVAPMALRHRLRRNPLDEAGSTVRIERAMSELFGT
jgi:magnesium chelatase subunit I